MPVTTLVVRTVPSGGMGPDNSMACSPWTSMARSNEPSVVRAGPPPPTTAANVGRTRWGPVDGVLRRVLELEIGGIERAGPDTQGVEQAIGRRPRALDRVRDCSDGFQVDGHGVLPSTAVRVASPVS